MCDVYLYSTMYRVVTIPIQFYSRRVQRGNCKENPPRRSTVSTEYTREPIQLNPDTRKLFYIKLGHFKSYDSFCWSELTLHLALYG